MKFGILSDIHGNVWALQAVLEDADRREIDRFINLGDIFYGPLQPRETYELLRTIDAITIQGNEDRLLYEPAHDPSPTLTYTVDQLGPEPIDWLRSLPATQWIAEEVFACHGTPTTDQVYLLEDVATGLPCVRPDAAIQQLLAEIHPPIVLCGHSHIPRVVQLTSGTLVINPGSVGLPAYDDDTPTYHRMETFTALASYAVLEKRSNRWQVDLLKVPYAVDLAADYARQQWRSDWAKWLSTGRV